MPRITQLDPKNATGETKELFDKLGAAGGGNVINIFRAMGNSPALLKAYMGMSSALKSGKISPRIREQIAIAVGEANGCDYCVAAHAVMGAKAGLSDSEVLSARKGTAEDPREKAAIDFSNAIVGKEGFVSEEDLVAVKEAGFSEEEVCEIIGLVCLNLFTNYFNHVAETEVDFPAQPPL